MTRQLGVLAAIVAFGVGSAQAGDLVDGRKGVSITAPLAGGIAQAAFDLGVGNLALEFGLGSRLTSGDKGDSNTIFNLAVGAHFMALRAEKAALSIGGRLNFTMDSVSDTEADGKEYKSKSRNSFAIDVPMRVYWFADDHFSFHFETGLRYAFALDDGNVFTGHQTQETPSTSSGSGDSDSTAASTSPPVAGGAKTSEFGLFDKFAGIGATFWW